MEVAACLGNASLTPQAQRQQVMDHSPLRRAVCALGSDVHEIFRRGDFHWCFDYNGGIKDIGGCFIDDKIFCILSDK